LTDMWSISARADVGLATRVQTDALVRSQDEESLGEKRRACVALVAWMGHRTPHATIPGLESGLVALSPNPHCARNNPENLPGSLNP